MAESPYDKLHRKKPERDESDYHMSAGERAIAFFCVVGIALAVINLIVELHG